MAGNLDAPLAVQDAPDLGPLRASHEADQLETELKALFMAMFGQYVRPGLTALSTVGVPHLGDLDQLERAVKTDGLALQRGADEASMRYLHKAFRARNPKRGLHMLRTYLQVLFRDGWTMDQMWQAAGSAYPEDLSDAYEPGRFLTSRVHLTVISSGAIGRPELLAQSLRSVIPARMVLNVTLSVFPITAVMGMAAAFTGVASRGLFTGEFGGSKERRLSQVFTGVAATGYATGERVRFTGTFTTGTP